MARRRQKKQAHISALAKWPRHYAQEIIKEHDIEKRREMLSKVPEDLRGLTREHVENYAALKKHRKL